MLILFFFSVLCCLFVKFIDCVTLNQNVEFVYKQNGVLNCSAISNSPKVNVSFYGFDPSQKLTWLIDDDWYPSKYYLSGDYSNVLNIVELRRADVNKTYFCNSTKGDRINFITQVMPYLYKPESPSISVIEGDTANITCYLLVGIENNQRINWTWIFNNEPIITNNNDKYSIEVSSDYTNSTLSVMQAASPADRGVYYCTATNAFGSFGRQVTLRVKSKYAVLWPFIGLFIEVVALLIIIIYFEIKKNKERKAR